MAALPSPRDSGGTPHARREHAFPPTGPRTAVPGRPGLSVVPGAVPAPRPRPSGSAAAGYRSRFKASFKSNPARVTAALLVVFAVVFGLVLLNIYVAQNSFHLSDLQRRAAALQTEQRRLRYEVARAESPENVVEMGASLGLVAPGNQKFLEGPSVLVSERTPIEGKESSR